MIKISYNDVIGSADFDQRTLDEIIEDIISNLTSVFEKINVSPGQYIYQIIKFLALEELQIEESIKIAASNQSITEAGPNALERHGIECGIERKSSTYATGHVSLNGTANSQSVPIGSTVSTASGINFLTTEIAIFPTYIEMTRDSGQTDEVPEPYSNIGSVEWVNTRGDQSGTSYTEGTDYTFSDDVITWNAGKGPAEDATYYIGISGDLTSTVAIQAESAGSDSVVGMGSITVNNTGVSLTSVSNASATSGGYDEESAHDFRVRLLEARRRTFTIGRIRDIIAGIDGVRSVKVEQDVGTDQISCGDDDWTTYSESGSEISNPYNYNQIIQTFVPGSNIVAMNKVTVSGKKSGSPPNLKLELIYWGVSGYQYTGNEEVLATQYYEPTDVDPDSPTTTQDLEIKLKYGGLDSSRVYGLVFSQSGATSSGYWTFLTHTSGYGSDYKKMLYKVTDSGTSGWTPDSDLIFKTHWGGASYTATIAPEAGYNYDDIETEIDNLLDYVDGDGFSPVSIQYNTQQATEVYINVSATIYIDSDNYEFTEISNNIESDINTYVSSLDSGDNVLYSKIYYYIMQENGILKASNIQIKRNDGSWSTDDITISDTEIPVLDTGSYGPGTNFTQGTFSS